MRTLNFVKVLTPFMLLFFSIKTVNAQPKIQGKLKIDMERGLFNCEFKMSNIPELKNYKILLNKGMNPKYFKTADGRLLNYAGFYNGTMMGEALAYYLVDDKGERSPLLSSLDIAYSGAFPIYKDEFNVLDYKGLIAFNGKTLRATEQSKWYPVIYDADNDKLIDAYTYDIYVEIQDSQESSIFLNGSAPQKAKVVNLKTDKPVPLLLFAGQYDFVQNQGDYILNAKLDAETAAGIFKNVELIKQVLSKNMNREYRDKIYLINHTPVNKPREGSSWGFNTFPSFAFAGLDFNSLITKEGRFTDEDFKFFGHEFGHNYFGLQVMSGPLKWFWLESFAEYLSYNVIQRLAGDKFLKQTLVEQAQSLGKKEYTPLAAITKDDQIDGEYRYVLGPLIIKCFEDEFGSKRTNQTIQNLLTFAEKETLSIDVWAKSAVKSGISEKQFDDFKRKYLVDKDFKTTVQNQILQNYK